MLAIDAANNIASMPTPEAAGTPGFFRAGSDPVQTTVTNDWANGLQSEVLAVITAMGLTPSKTVLNQMLQALMLNKINYNTTTGSANAYILTNTVPFAAYVAGMRLVINANFSNTAAATINVDGLGVKNIILNSGNSLQPGNIQSAGIFTLVYNGTSFVLIDPVVQPVAFRAYQSGSPQAVGASPIVVNFETETFDTMGFFNNTTMQFLPLIAGYYRVTASLGVTVTGTAAHIETEIFKNGVVYSTDIQIDTGSFVCNVNDIVYLNGSTDYIDIQVTNLSGGTTIDTSNNTNRTYFTAELIR